MTGQVVDVRRRPALAAASALWPASSDIDPREVKRIIDQAVVDTSPA
jgi:hypothetical protein